MGEDLSPLAPPLISARRVIYGMSPPGSSTGSTGLTPVMFLASSKACLTAFWTSMSLTSVALLTMMEALALLVGAAAPRAARRARMANVGLHTVWLSMIGFNLSALAITIPRLSLDKYHRIVCCVYPQVTLVLLALLGVYSRRTGARGLTALSLIEILEYYTRRTGYLRT